MHNAWDKKRNPYLFNAFRVTRMSPSTLSQGRIKQGLAKLRKKVQFSSFMINGETINEADVNDAGEVLVNLDERIAEEMLEHKVHKLEESDFDQAFANFKVVHLEEADLRAETPLIPKYSMILAQELATKIPRASSELQTNLLGLTPAEDPALGAADDIRFDR